MGGHLVTLKVMEKIFDDTWPKVEYFVLRLAPQLFPAEVAEATYISQLKGEVRDVGLALNTVNKYVIAGDNMFLIIHPNLHIDNAFFFHDEEGYQDCGLLDWAGTSMGFVLSVFISGGGALSLAGAEMRI